MRSQAARVLRIGAGIALVAAGTAMLVLPGPGWITIALGLALLARDFEWARAALDAVKRRMETLQYATRRRLGRYGDAARDGEDSGGPPARDDRPRGRER